ncbi:MAG: hypothetical protein K0R71_600 [Bacillales bacterium]|jgi:fructosamine-3-kinase|nr:hypothetical protein [Bacillales bacterium]
MNINSAIETLVSKGIVTEPVSVNKLSGGTTSEVWFVSDAHQRKYAIKFNEREVLEYETQFLKTYEETNWFPKVTYLDGNFDFLVYTFIEGETDHLLFRESLLDKIISLVRTYKIVDIPGYGWIDSPRDWAGFLQGRVDESKERIEEMALVVENQLVKACLKEISTHSFNKYLLHGDFGVHNFISKNGELVGVIDPTPVVGDRIYDVLYAVCSSPDFLNAITMDDLYKSLSSLGYKRKIIFCYLVVILYVRIGTCLKYHKEDFEAYLKLFNKLIESEIETNDSYYKRRN